MKVSKYLSLSEAVHSETAKRHGIKNHPNTEQLDAMKFVASFVFDRVREHVGVALYASSFFRSEDLNTAIRGSKTSQHCKGEAIDIDADFYGGTTNAEIFEFIKTHLKFDQLIWEFGDEHEPSWVHVSLKRTGTNRGQVLRALKTKGRTTYELYQ